MSTSTLGEGRSEVFYIPDFTLEQKRVLFEKINNTIWPNELEKIYGWSLGAPTWAVKPLVEQWVNTYNWEATKTELDRWHHYRIQIEGLKLHYIHEESTQTNAIPIVLLHGWPSTFYEFHKLIEPLRDGANQGQPFHVVVPSLPGFGFSEAPKEKGYGVEKVAKMINALMVHLGYEKYMYHGGDWGAIIGKWIATRHNANCKAYHTNLPMSIPPLPTLRNLIFHPLKVAKFLTSLVLGFDAVYGVGKTVIGGATFANAELNKECGYRAIQGTKPYTLAFGLTDSPVGLLGWMLEKYHDWSYLPDDVRAAQALPDTISSKEFLTQVTIYWLTNTMSSSIRLYYECLHQKEMLKVVLPRVKIPVAVCAFAHDIFKMPKEWLETSTDLHQFSEMPSGGHFPALEEPQLLLNDLQAFGKMIKHSKILD
ncbi:Alpha/Beta hydrolase protein [Mycotypha africana]|uniref:Alpha/Beta hydrolase protein n=1 Tax=Mycotypha africana TaxID=64632 RepID=UPI0023019746|nr:Alpha/Beta hydrolase protein [Mycotypha africana]KAI8987763.1 Alpha/Beta hydrolase protein [Mycotypha africana]